MLNAQLFNNVKHSQSYTKAFLVLCSPCRGIVILGHFFFIGTNARPWDVILYLNMPNK